MLTFSRELYISQSYDLKELSIASKTHSITNFQSPTVFTQLPDNKSRGVIHLGCINHKSIKYIEEISKYPKYLSSWLNIHPNQYIAGCQIIKHFTEATARKALLIAQMQSGKTGTAKYVVHHIKHCSHNLRN